MDFYNDVIFQTISLIVYNVLDNYSNYTCEISMSTATVIDIRSKFIFLLGIPFEQW